MKQFLRLFTSLVVPAFVMVGLVASPVMAQDKAKDAKAAPAAKAAAPKKGAPVVKNLIDNDKVHVYTTTFKPGDVSPSRARVQRVIHYMTAGTLQRIYPDGKTMDRKFKAGDVVWIEPETYAVKNVGKTTVHLYGMEVKEPKK